MNRRRLVLAATFLLGAASLAVAVRPSSSPAPVASAAQPRAAASTPSATAAGLTRAATDIGAQHTYAAVIHTVLSASDKGALRPMMGLGVRGTWRVTYAGEQGGHRAFELALEKPQITIEGRIDPSVQVQLEQQLAVPHVALVGADGRLQDLLVDPAIDGTVRKLWYGLAAAAQIVDGDGDEWTAEERDVSGTYLAEYERTGDALTKRKLRYLKLRSSSGPSSADGTARLGVDGSFELRRGSDGVLLSLQGHEQVWTEEGESFTGMQVRTEFSLTSTGVGVDATVASRLQQMRGTHVADALGGSARGGIKAPPKRTFAALADQLAAPGVEAHTLIPEMAQVFEYDPASIDAAVELLRSRPEVDPTDAMIAALGRAGTPAAQGALIALARDVSLPLDHTTEAIVELGRVDEPSADSVAAVKDLVDDPVRDRANTAALALGGMARRLAAHDRAAGDAVVADLISRLDAATSVIEMCRYLEALGNTGSAAARDAVGARLRHTSFEVRATAAGALRLVPGDDVQALLTQTLAGDAHVMVRVRAAFALGFRPLDVSFAALERALKQDKEAAVRMEVVGVLGNASRSGGPARQVIEWTAAHDADARVRRAAQQYL